VRHEKDPLPKYTDRRRGATPRRLAAAKRAIKRRQQGCGMLLDWAAEQNPTLSETPEERIARFDERAARYFQRLRDQDARMWRRGRRALYSLPDPLRRQLLTEWNTPRKWQPDGRPEYFCAWLRRRLLEQLTRDLGQRQELRAAEVSSQCP